MTDIFSLRPAKYNRHTDVSMRLLEREKEDSRDATLTNLGLT